MKLSISQFEKLFEESRKQNLAFFLDWNFPVEDIVFNIKNVCPELDIKCLPEKRVQGEWFQAMIIEGKEYTFSTKSESLIQDVVSTTNKHLEKSNQTLVFFDTQDDNRYFFLINLSDLPQYKDQGFIQI
jgi:hypothetical protein